MNSTYFGLLAEFGEANVLLARVAPKYFGLSFEEARRRASGQKLPCRVFRLGGQKTPWLVSMSDLAELIDKKRQRAGEDATAARKAALVTLSTPLRTPFRHRQNAKV